MRILQLLSALFAMLAAPASAATYVFDGESENTYTFRDAWDTDGEYVVSLDFDRPVTDLFVSLFFVINYAPTASGGLIGTGETQYFAGPVTSASSSFSFTEPYPSGVLGYEYDGGDIFFRSEGPVRFTVTTSVVGMVPEPATWGLMILGFGAVGGAMRARRKQTSQLRSALA